MNTFEFLKQNRFVAIFRHIAPEYTRQAAQALYDGGIRVFEITFNPSSPTTIADTKKIITEIIKGIDRPLPVKEEKKDEENKEEKKEGEDK